MKDRHKQKVHSLRDLRLMVGLTQDELGKLAGVAPMYISLIENNKRALTKTTAEKIASVISQLLRSDGSEIFISPEELRASHIASFYPDHIKTYVGRFLYLTAQAAEGLEHFYHEGELPVSEEELYIKMEIIDHLTSLLPERENKPAVDLASLEKIVNSNRDLIETNKELLLGRVENTPSGRGSGFQSEIEKTIYKPNKLE